MRPRTHLLSVLVVLALAVGAQVAYTDVGREIGGEWSAPDELSRLDGGSTAAVTDVAAAGDGDRAAVAWVETDAGTRRVRVATLERGPDGVTVTGRRTVARTDAEVPEVDVALRGDRIAVAFVDASDERIRLWRGDGLRTVSAPDAARVVTADVALLPDRAAVAWRTYADGGFVGRLALVEGDAVERRTLPGATTGLNAPALAAGTDGHLAIAWANASDTGVHLAVAPPAGEFAGRRLADARSGASSLGSSNRPPTVDVAASGGAPVVAWTDLSVVQVGAPGAEPVTLGPGAELRVAGAAGEWTATWTVADRTSGRDLVYARRTSDGLRRGHVSRLPSNALSAAPFRLGGRPAVAWVESGDGHRLLVSGYTGGGPLGPLARLSATPLRFGFLSLVAVVIAVVTVPLLPWVAGPLLAGFLLTTRVSLSFVGRVGSRLAGLFGRSVPPGRLRSAVQEAPPWAALAAFVPANLAVFYLLGQGGVVPGVPAVEPVGLSALALVATVAVARLRDTDSPWRLAFLFGYCQSVALWAVTTPSFL